MIFMAIASAENLSWTTSKPRWASRPASALSRYSFRIALARAGGSRGDEKARLPVDDDLGDAAGLGGDNGQAAGHGVHDRAPQPFHARGQDEEVERGEDAGDVLAKAQKVNDVLDAELMGLLVELHPQGPLSDDDDPDSGGVILEDPRRFDEVPVPLVVLELGHDPDEIFLRAEAELFPEEIPFLDLPERGEIDARRDDRDEPLRDSPLDEDLADPFGDGNDGVDPLDILAPGPDGEIHPPRDDADGDVGPGRGPRADGGPVGVVEVGQDAAPAAHGPGKPVDGPEVRLALHGDRQDRKARLDGLGLERGIRLDDEFEGVAFLLELPGQEERLALAAAPFAPGVNMKKAQFSPLFSRSPAAWRSV